MNEDERQRLIFRALLYNRGYYGKMAKYADSVSYAGTNTASHLSDIDWKAVQLMYGKKIKNSTDESECKDNLLMTVAIDRPLDFHQ